jgi:hypothetical protein
MTSRSARVVCGAAVLTAVLCVSCSMKQTIVIRADGSGTLAMQVEVSPILHEYVARLSEVSDKPVLGPGGAFFDAESIGKDFESRSGITVTRAVTPSRDAVELDLTFNSIQDVFAQDQSLKKTAALAYSESDGKKTIRLHLDRGNYPQLARMFPLLASPAFAAFGPQPNDTTTDDEYMEMIRFSIGDDAPALLRRSVVTLTLAPEGQILTQSGGEITGNAVIFRIPLLRLLVLDRALDYSVTFK